MTLLRSNLPPDDPRTVAALATDDGGPLPQYLPQRMGFSKYKTPPGVKPRWGQNAVSMLTALEQQHLQAALIRRGYYLPPTESAEDAAERLGADRLPEPSDNLDPNLNDYPVSRGVQPGAGFISGQELNAMAQDRERELQRLGHDAGSRRANALAEVAAMQNGLMGLFKR
jgi:hypothetical protein